MGQVVETQEYALLAVFAEQNYLAPSNGKMHEHAFTCYMPALICLLCYMHDEAGLFITMGRCSRMQV